MAFDEVASSQLFRGMTGEERETCLAALRAHERHYGKNGRILHAGDATEEMGMVLSGSVTIEMNDLWGNGTILGHVGAGGFFAESYAMLPGEVMLVDVRANEETRVLLMNLSPLRAGGGEPWQVALTRNLLMIATRKNQNLTERSFHTGHKTIRGRVLSYLNAVALRQGSREVTIPFDRQQLADYLCVERTALSKELSKMRAEGLIACHKNRFVLRETDGE